MVERWTIDGFTYCPIMKDDGGFVRYSDYAALEAQLAEVKDEPAAFLVERIAGSGYGRARKVIDAAIYDPRRDDFWIGDGKKNHLVTPLYALSAIEATPLAPKVTEEFKQYRRKQVAELRPWSPGECMDGVSVSGEDAKAGSPKLGDMIARNPKNHDDKWLVAAAYFADNFEPLPALTAAQEAGKP